MMKLLGVRGTLPPASAGPGGDEMDRDKAKKLDVRRGRAQAEREILEGMPVAAWALLGALLDDLEAHGAMTPARSAAVIVAARASLLPLRPSRYAQTLLQALQLEWEAKAAATTH